MKNNFLHFFLLIAILTISGQGNCQVPSDFHVLYFVSDCQQPLKIEKIRLRHYRNEEARDSLFSDIIRQKPRNLFFLGDLTSSGSNKKSWNPITKLLLSLSSPDISIHAIPGNHEYYLCARRGIQNYERRFPRDSMFGYCVKVDSMAIVMLNSNFNKLNSSEIQKQQNWYLETMNSLDADSGIKMILLCSHHPPYTNSKIVKPSVEVSKFFLPRFNDSPKSKLYISGHSHNLEFFGKADKKYFLVIGGGGGLTQPLYSADKRLFSDLIQQDKKPIYFYLVTERRGDSLHLFVRGLQRDFNSIKTFEIGTIQ
jgi:predicted MPP superfamily phosphohydrolase